MLRLVAAVSFAILLSWIHFLNAGNPQRPFIRDVRPLSRPKPAPRIPYELIVIHHSALGIPDVQASAPSSTRFDGVVRQEACLALQATIEAVPMLFPFLILVEKALGIAMLQRSLDRAGSGGAVTFTNSPCLSA